MASALTVRLDQSVQHALRQPTVPAVPDLSPEQPPEGADDVLIVLPLRVVLELFLRRGHPVDHGGFGVGHLDRWRRPFLAISAAHPLERDRPRHTVAFAVLDRGPPLLGVVPADAIDPGVV